MQREYRLTSRENRVLDAVLSRGFDDSIEVIDRRRQDRYVDVLLGGESPQILDYFIQEVRTQG